MGKRRVQHRQTRDTNTKVQREYEQENRQLKREVARLRKQLDQAEAPIEENEKEEPKSTLKCPTCNGTNIASISTPSGKTRFICRDCGWRGQP